jgi:hypothetical protein
VIVRNNFWDPLDQIKIGLHNHLSGQVSFINNLLQSPAEIISNLDKQL